jgi:hypothetical protein
MSATFSEDSNMIEISSDSSERPEFNITNHRTKRVKREKLGPIPRENNNAGPHLATSETALQNPSGRRSASQPGKSGMKNGKSSGRKRRRLGNGGIDI